MGAPPGQHSGVPQFDPGMQRAIAAHGGVLSRAELLALGLSSSAIVRRVRSGELRTVVPGVYRPATVPMSPELELRAIALRFGSDGTISGRSAAWWHGLTRMAARPAEVVLSPDRWHSQWPGLIVSRRRLHPADRMVLRGVPVTGRARTVLDCAASADAENIRDTALQRGTTIRSLELALERLGPGRGATAARRLVAEAKDGGVSHYERVLLRPLQRSGSERWTAGLWVRVSSIQEYWVDLAAEVVRLAVEVDGWRVHSQAEAYHSDRERQNALVGAGWTILRYTPRQLRDDLDAVVTEILRVTSMLRQGCAN